MRKRTTSESSALPRTFLQGQVELLEQLAQGRPPGKVLVGLVELAENVLEELHGSIMRYHPEQESLSVAAAPNLPSEYVDAIDGMPAGPQVGSCGTAAWKGQRVITEDVKADPRWDRFRELLLPHGFRACWSLPIKDSDGSVLGTFAFYHPTPETPSDAQYRILEESCHLASVVLERTRREEVLQETRERHLDFLEEAPVGIYRSTPEGDLLYANSALVDMLGAGSVDDLKDIELRNLYVDQSGRSGFKSEMATQGTVQQRETRLHRLDGDVIDVMESARAVRDGSGTVEYYEGILQDITERKDAQRALRDREKKLRTIIENVQPIFFMIDRDGTFLLSEGADLESIGLEPGEAVGHSVYEMFADHPEVTDQVTRALNGETVIQTSAVDGRIFDTWCTPYYDENDEITACIGMATDITERRQAKTQLEETKNFYEQILQQLPMELAVFNPDARFKYVNPEGIGRPKDREWVIGRTNEEYCRHYGLPPEIGQRRDDAIRKVVRTKEPERIEETVPTSEGTRQYIRLHVPVTNLEGEVSHVLGCALDITKRARYEDELREAKEEAEEASRLKSAMLANMSHEIRTPLTSITGFAEVIKDEGTETDVEHFAELIARSARRLMNTLDSVLQLSKLEAGARALKRERVDLTEEATAIVTEQEARSEAEGLDLRVEATSAGPVLAYCDPTAVQRVLANLIGNSLKFTDEGEVIVRTFHQDDRACLQVSDTGIGMSDSFQREMFEAFKQESDGLRRSHDGSGLGLALVKELVERHDGTLTVESSRGEGTTITACFPRFAEAD